MHPVHTVQRIRQIRNLAALQPQVRKLLWMEVFVTNAEYKAILAGPKTHNRYATKSIIAERALSGLNLSGNMSATQVCAGLLQGKALFKAGGLDGPKESER